MFNRILVAGVFFFLMTTWYKSSYAQASRSTITGKIIDSSTQQPLGLATVTVFRARDTSLITYRMSTPDGAFKVPNLPADELIRVIISFSGFSVYRNELQLTGAEQKDLGTIIMAPNARELEEVLVTAERPPVIIKKDTIEFNALAFKTLPTALVEDLLKKLPGVQVDAEGNIAVNGRRVNRLLVDGRDFFGSDPKMATRNLPADIIDKVQVTEDKNDAELNPDKAKRDIGQVINLRLKKSIKKGWFGKAYAGGGSDERYEAGSIVNLFKDTLQVSVLGFANNLDRAAFSIRDIRSLGGFNRSGVESRTTTNGKGLNINGISFGGMGQGISTSLGTGFNMNNVLKNGLTLNTMYFYGQSRNSLTEIINRDQYLHDTILTTRSNRNGVMKTFGHNIAFGLNGNLSKTARFEFKPTIAITDERSENVTTDSTTNSYSGLLNESTNNLNLNGKDVSYNHSLLFFKTFDKKRRSFNLSNSTSYGRLDVDQVNNAFNRFYDIVPPQDSIIDQLRRRNAKNFETVINANYNEPLGKKMNLRLGYSLNVNRDMDDLATFHKSNNGKYETINPGFSNEIERTSWRNSISSGLNWKDKSFNATININLVSIDINNGFGKAIPSFEQHYKYILPGANINWKDLSFAYNVSVTPPSIVDVQPVPDNTNPLFIQYGNPELTPTVVNNVSLEYTKNIQHKYLFFTTHINAWLRDNNIVQARRVQPDGVQETRPVNVDGTYNIYHFASFTKQHKLNRALQFNVGINSIISFGHNFVIVNDRKSFVNTTRINPSVTTGLNWKDIIECTANYSKSVINSRYELNDFTNLEIRTSSLSNELVIRWPKHIVFETQIDHRYNSQVAPGIPRSITLWNAAINYLFLAKDKGQLKFSVFDILKQNNNVIRQVTENYIQDRQINTLTQYFLVTFTYNIRDFKAGKVGGKQRFFYY
jgi:hypothetical protein